jgi:hypothetical protein
MSLHDPNLRGGLPVGQVDALDPVGIGAVLYLRLWCDGPEAQAKVWRDFSVHLGPQAGRAATQALERLCDLCQRHGRRPLMRHHASCRCLGSDEACFANFVCAAAEGEREDAMLIATMLVRADHAPTLAALAEDFGMALRRMALAARPGQPAPVLH